MGNIGRAGAATLEALTTDWPLILGLEDSARTFWAALLTVASSPDVFTGV